MVKARGLDVVAGIFVLIFLLFVVYAQCSRRENPANLKVMYLNAKRAYVAALYLEQVCGTAPDTSSKTSQGFWMVPDQYRFIDLFSKDLLITGTVREPFKACVSKLDKAYFEKFTAGVWDTEAPPQEVLKYAGAWRLYFPLAKYKPTSEDLRKYPSVHIEDDQFFFEFKHSDGGIQ